jgi:hypothetical protein
VSTTIVGTLVEVRDTFLVLDGKVDDLVVGERLMVTATSQRGPWTADSIERYPV